LFFISKVFGKEYKIIDNYARRVRLPTTDYLVVTRVTDLDAKINEYKKSYMATEYDVPTDAPFLIDGHIPWSVAVESGQCDLMLISYVGIDFQNKSERIYRLLGCELTFLKRWNLVAKRSATRFILTLTLKRVNSFYSSSTTIAMSEIKKY